MFACFAFSTLLAWSSLFSIIPHLNKYDNEHSVDIWWNFKKQEDIQMMSIDMQFNANIFRNNNVYIAPLFSKIHGKDFYLGYVSRIPDARALSGMSLAPDTLGPGLVLARWGTLNRKYIRPTPDSYFLITDQEGGNYVSVRTERKLAPGNYTFKLTSKSTDRTGWKNKIWYLGQVIDKNTGKAFEAGEFCVDEDPNSAVGKICSFVELFTWPTKELGDVTITFSNPMVNNRPAEITYIAAVYPKGSLSIADARYSKESNSVIVDLQNCTERNDKQRIVYLKQ